jgi:hypothetical protein
MATHRFTPSRPDGTVCIAERVSPLIGASAPEVCGYPAGHPIHAGTWSEDETCHPSGDGGWICTPWKCDRPNDCPIPWTDAPADRATGLSAAEHPHALTIAATPAEARTGVSDRTAAARAALAELRDVVSTNGRMPQRDARMAELLRTIEQAL